MDYIPLGEITELNLKNLLGDGIEFEMYLAGVVVQYKDGVGLYRIIHSLMSVGFTCINIHDTYLSAKKGDKIPFITIYQSKEAVNGL